MRVTRIRTSAVILAGGAGGPDGDVTLVGLRARVSSPVPPGRRFPEED